METSNETSIVPPVNDVFQAAQTNAENEIKASSEAQPKRKSAASKAQPKRKPSASKAQPKHKPSASKAPPKRKPSASKAQPKGKPTASEAQPKRKPTARNMVLGAIRQLKSARGSSFADIRKYLENKYESSDIDVKNLKLFVTTAVEKGVLEKEGGKYKIKELGKPTNKSPTKRLMDKTEPGVMSLSGQGSKVWSEQREEGKPEKRKRVSSSITEDVKSKEKNRSKKSQEESVQPE